jgi:anti-sigma factor RsiW
MVQPQGVSPTAFARDALAAHVLFVSEKRHPVEVPAAQEAHLVAWLSKRLDTPIQAPDLQSQGFSLLGGRLLPGGDAPLAQLMYESKAGERLTLTVKHAAQRTDQTGFGILEKNGTSVFYWIDQRYGYALAGNIGKPRLLAIAQAVEAPVMLAYRIACNGPFHRDSNCKKISHPAEASRATLLGLRQVLSSRFAELWKRLGAHAAPG